MKTLHKLSGSISARWARAFAITALALVVGMATTVQATVNTVAWYRLGEDDPGSGTNLLGQTTSIDSSGNGFNLSRVGSPTNRADTVFSQKLATTLSMQFNGSSSYATNIAITTLTTNVGMEIWAKPLATPTSPGVLGGAIYNGNSYGIELTSDTNWEFRIGGIGVVVGRRAVLNQWQHLGLVLTDAGGVNRLERFYIDGVLVTNYITSVNTPTGNFAIGSLFGSSHFFNGLLDNARVFTFTGAFDPHDFLIPEPSFTALLIIGGALTFWRRRC